ncbi:MAG TPA: hypothetical protein VF553_03750 [Pyrinomonadaceae bacterium]|jgi:hypothetical protein
MTNEEHNRMLGIMHLAYGGLHGLIMLLIAVLFAVFVPVVSDGVGTRDGMPLTIYAIFLTLISLAALFYAVPSLVAGYALLKRKPWARLAGIIASVLAGMNVPLGTALCVYSLWFFFGQGAGLYEPASLSSTKNPYALPEASSRPASSFDRRSREQAEGEPLRPSQMPNWRD